MNKVLLFVGSIVWICSSLVVTGCSGAKEGAIVWPAPPDEPRVAFVRSLRGEDDFSSGVGAALSSIAGERSIIHLKTPFDVCVAGKDIVYVSDLSQGIMKFDIGRGNVEPIGEKSTEELKDPRGIAYGHGQLFIGLLGSGRITVLDDDGRLVRNIGVPGQFPSVIDIVHDSLRNRIVFIENTMHQVFVYSETGDSLFTIGRRGQDTAAFNYPQSVAVDRDGNIYVVDAFNFRVQVFDVDGGFLSMFGRQGDVWGAFNRPKGISTDSYGNIYVLDAMHQNFQIFNRAGEVLLFVGKYSKGNDGFINPVSIAIDAENIIYVTDQLNSRVQVFKLLKGN